MTTLPAASAIGGFSILSSRFSSSVVQWFYSLMKGGFAMARPTGLTRRLGIALLVAAAVAAIRRANRVQGYRQSLPWRLYDEAAQTLDQTYGWHRLPLAVSLAAL